ncbi:hypothetical protein DIPPA_54430 [Diplonema papillatum]|nr:hypothetical protein DIPPA_54430 [Diplonema papillatum]
MLCMQHLPRPEAPSSGGPEEGCGGGEGGQQTRSSRRTTSSRCLRCGRQPQLSAIRAIKKYGISSSPQCPRIPTQHRRLFSRPRIPMQHRRLWQQGIALAASCSTLSSARRSPPLFRGRGGHLALLHILRRRDVPTRPRPWPPCGTRITDATGPCSSLSCASRVDPAPFRPRSLTSFLLPNESGRPSCKR